MIVEICAASIGRISIYAAFIFGLDNDTSVTFKTALTSRWKKFYYAAFNHLLPFPETPLYNRLKQENRLPMPSGGWIEIINMATSLLSDPRDTGELTEGCLSAAESS